MKFNFKKVASVIASAVMITSTVGFAAAATYPAPFTSGAAIVYGANAAPSDIAAAISISNNLNGKVTTTGSTGAMATGGDSVNLATSSQNLFFGSALNSAKTTLTRTELPTLLADGTITDSGGTAYTYSQAVTLGNRTIKYGTASGNAADPALYLDGNIDTTSPLYTYKLTFNKNINVSNSNVIGNDITILGTKFTIGSGSTSTTLNLYGAGTQTTINEGDSADVTIGDVKHTVKVTGVTQSGSTNVVYVSVDGASAQKINEGSSSNLGGVQIYAKTVFYSGKTGSTNYASLNLGTSVLTLNSGSSVLVGTEQTPIQNTLVTLGTSGSQVSSITLAVAMQDSTKDYILAGSSFTDPVFGGLKVQFADVNPAIDATTRDSVVVDSDNRNLRATFTSALAGSSTTFNFLHDQRTDTGSGNPLSPGNLLLADSANKTLHVTENEPVMINEHTMINSGDYGRIIKLTSVPTGALLDSSTIQFQDDLTQQNIFSGGLVVGKTGNATTNIDGQPYYFAVMNGTLNSSVQITWGTNANYNKVGTQTTISPKIKLANGEWLAFMTNSTITNASTYVLPGYDTLTTYEAGQAITCPQGAVGQLGSVVFGNINYTLSEVSNSTCTIIGISTNNAGMPTLNFTMGGAVIVQELKKTTESGNSNDGDIIGTYPAAIGSSTITVGVASPAVSHGTTYATTPLTSWTSDSNKQTGVTRYGSLITYRTDNNHKVQVDVPNQQMVADVLFTSTGATITPGTTSGGTGAVNIITDADVTSYKNSNLIVVGGSCINSAALKIVSSTATSPICGADFTTSTKVGPGQYIVKTIASPYADAGTGNVAMLVAGYEAAETTLAAKQVLEGVDTTVGTSQVYPIATASQ